jgi:hypothetical protein
MKKRCYDEKSDHYYLYGGRGIMVCERWLGEDGYQNFEADMGPRPTPDHQLDRKNTNGNYEPSNCMWSTRKEQQRNRRVNRMVTIGGRTQCLAAWAEEVGLCFKTLEKRLRNKWPEHKLLIPPLPGYRTTGNTGRKKANHDV